MYCMWFALVLQPEPACLNKNARAEYLCQEVLQALACNQRSFAIMPELVRLLAVTGFVELSVTEYLRTL